MSAIDTRLLERLTQLPPGCVAEVLDFVEFLAAREERAAAAVRLGEAMAKLDALDPVKLSQEEQAARRHAGSAGALFHLDEHANDETLPTSARAAGVARAFYFLGSSNRARRRRA